MPMNMTQLRTLLDPDEPNYAQMKALLQPDDIDALEAIVAGADVLLASKAAYAISLIGTQRAVDALSRVVASPHAEVRTAVSGGLSNLRDVDVAWLTERLLGDDDTSVRKNAVKATAVLRITTTKETLRKIASEDRVPGMRSLANRALDALR